MNMEFLIETQLANRVTNRTRNVFDIASRLAAVDALRLFGHNYFGTEHLLIGLTTSGLKSSQSLQRLGKEPQLLRNEALSLLGCKKLA